LDKFKFVITYDLFSLLDTLKSKLLSIMLIYTCCFWVEIRPIFDQICLQTFSAEIVTHKIDPWKNSWFSNCRWCHRRCQRCPRCPRFPRFPRCPRYCRHRWRQIGGSDCCSLPFLWLIGFLSSILHKVVTKIYISLDTCFLTFCTKYLKKY
jgi:hypothetical protein